MKRIRKQIPVFVQVIFSHHFNFQIYPAWEALDEQRTRSGKIIQEKEMHYDIEIGFFDIIIIIGEYAKDYEKLINFCNFW